MWHVPMQPKRVLFSRYAQNEYQEKSGVFGRHPWDDCEPEPVSNSEGD